MPRVGKSARAVERRSHAPRPTEPAEVRDPVVIRKETEAAKNAAGVRALVLAWPSILEKGLEASWAPVAEGVAVAAVHLVSSREANLRALSRPSYAYGLARAASAFGASPVVVSALKPLVRAFSSDTDEHNVAATASALATLVGGCCFVFLPKLAALLTTGSHRTTARANRIDEAGAQRDIPPVRKGTRTASTSAAQRLVGARVERPHAPAPDDSRDPRSERARGQHRAPSTSTPRIANPASSTDRPEHGQTPSRERPSSPERTPAPASALDPAEADASTLGDGLCPSQPATIRNERALDEASRSNALEALDARLTSIPQRGIALEDVRACLERGHRTEDMRRLLRLRLERVPEDEHARRALAEALTSAGQYAAALDELEYLIAAAPEDLSNPLAALKVLGAHLDAVEGTAAGRSARMAAIAFAHAAGHPTIASEAYEEARRSLWSLLNFEAPAPEPARTRDAEALREAFKLRAGSGFKRALDVERKRGTAQFTTTAPDGTHRMTMGKYVGIGARNSYVYEDPTS